MHKNVNENEDMFVSVCLEGLKERMLQQQAHLIPQFYFQYDSPRRGSRLSGKMAVSGAGTGKMR